MGQVLVSAVAIVSLLIVVALGGVVWRLRAEVRRLAAEVDDIGAPDSAGSRQARPPESAGSRQAQPPDSAGSRQARPPERVGSRQARPPTSAEPAVLITAVPDLGGSDEAVDVTASRVAAVTLGKPLVKAAAFTYGVRRALDEEHRLWVVLAFRQELRRQRRQRRQQRRGAQGSSTAAPSGSNG